MRLPIRTILAPTDFSDASQEAVQAASDLALTFGAELVLVHVVSALPSFRGNIAPTAPGFNIDMFQRDLIADWGQELEALAGQLRAGDKEKRVRTIIKEGDPGGNIVELAEKEDVDLVVIATHGRTGFARFVFGSVAEKVVRRSSRPVLVIPAGRQSASKNG